MAAIIINEKSAKNIVGFIFSMVTAALMLVTTVAIIVDGASVTTVAIYGSITAVSVIASLYFSRKVG